MLSDGSVVDFGLVLELSGRGADIAGFVEQLAEKHRAEIEARWPEALRRVGGYNLYIFDSRGTALHRRQQCRSRPPADRGRGHARMHRKRDHGRHSLADSSAFARMHPGVLRPSPRGSWLPRVRADAPPYTKRRYTRYRAPPRSRGCTHHGARNPDPGLGSSAFARMHLHHVGQALSRSTSPAYARMHPRMSGAARHSLRLSRVCADFLGSLVAGGGYARWSAGTTLTARQGQHQQQQPQRSPVFQAWVAGGAGLRDRRGWDPFSARPRRSAMATSSQSANLASCLTHKERAWLWTVSQSLLRTAPA